MPNGQLSYARPGDERWTWVSPDDNTALSWTSDHYRDAAYNKEDGFFYVARTDSSVQTLDLNGPSPVAKTIFRGLNIHHEEPHRYLIHSPWGDVVLSCKHNQKRLEDEDDVRRNDFRDPLVELTTVEIQLYKTDNQGQRTLKSPTSLGDHALFLGYNSSLCLPVKDIPGLKPNHAYIADDSYEFINYYFKQNKPQVGVWSFKETELGGPS